MVPDRVPPPGLFAIAIETFTPDVDFSPNLGVRLWFGDQALARAMNLPIDGKPNRLEFDGSGNALKMIKDLVALFDHYIVWLEYIPVWCLLVWEWLSARARRNRLQGETRLA